MIRGITVIARMDIPGEGFCQQDSFPGNSTNMEKLETIPLKDDDDFLKVLIDSFEEELNAVEERYQQIDDKLEHP